jgi:catechol 2,3-dioxygenase-like lactoylglutathione lyase family enzyme
MLGSLPVVAFVATTDSKRALAFYRDVIGLPLVADTLVALIFDAGGTTLRVAKVESLTPQPFTALGWRVADIASAVASLRGRGVVFEQYDGMGQDDAGIWASPDGGYVAWFKDPDGNLLSLSHP